MGRRHRALLLVAAPMVAGLALLVAGPASAAEAPVPPATDPASVAIGWFDGCADSVCKGWAHQDFAYPQASHAQLQVAIWVDGVPHEVLRVSATQPAEPAVGGAYRWTLSTNQLRAAGLPAGAYVIRPYAISLKPDGTPSFTNPPLPLVPGTSNVVAVPARPAPASVPTVAPPKKAVATPTPTRRSPRPAPAGTAEGSSQTPAAPASRAGRGSGSTPHGGPTSVGGTATVAIPAPVTVRAASAPVAGRSGFRFVWAMLTLAGIGIAVVVVLVVLFTRDLRRRPDEHVGQFADGPWDPFRRLPDQEPVPSGLSPAPRESAADDGVPRPGGDPERHASPWGRNTPGSD